MPLTNKRLLSILNNDIQADGVVGSEPAALEARIANVETDVSSIQEHVTDTTIESQKGIFVTGAGTTALANAGIIFGDAGVGATIQSTGAAAKGSIVGGLATGTGSTISNNATGCIVVGYTKAGGTLSATNDGSAVFGAAYENGTITAGGIGSFATGFVSTYGEPSGRIYSGSAGGFGTFASGWVIGGGFIGAYGNGAFASGAMDNRGGHTGYIHAKAIGSFAQGYVDRCNRGIYSGSLGSFAQGFAYSDNGYIGANGSGSFAQGYVYNGQIKAGQQGTFAHGYIWGGGVIDASGIGAVAIAYATGGGKVYSNGNFSVVMARAGGDTINATGRGAIIMGTSWYNSSYITASGDGSVVFCYTQDSNPATNAVDNSLQVGPDNTQVRIIGSGAPLTPRNGDIWVANNYTYVRSNGVSVKIT